MDNKKLLVLSDTHGNITALKAVLNWAKDRSPPNDTICCAAFLGDGISDLYTAANATGFSCDWKVVGGNNDYGHQVPETAAFDFTGNRFFMCHGHRHSLYGGYHSLVSAAHSIRSNSALFGHSHVPFQKNIDGILLINPGSVGRPRSRIGATFAVVECAEGEQPKPEFWGIDPRGEIRKVKV
ncbi:MAG: metallophosphatase family protein [Treponema sp.]|jgi:putative phosphoesterase|nr:metallophosphatase family protein [Treponema sp.]